MPLSRSTPRLTFCVKGERTPAVGSVSALAAARHKRMTASVATERAVKDTVPSQLQVCTLIKEASLPLTPARG